MIISQNVTAAGAAGITYAGSTGSLTIADLSHVWVIVDVYENDLASVHLGQHADIHLNAFPGKTFSGTISDIGAVLDPSIRTAKVRIQVENPGGLLRIGMFATATILASHAEQMAAVPVTPHRHRHCARRCQSCWRAIPPPLAILGTTPLRRRRMRCCAHSGYLSRGPRRTAAGPAPDPKDRLAELHLYERAGAAMDGGRMSEAAALLNRVLATDPQNTLARRDLGVVYLEEIFMPRPAIVLRRCWPLLETTTSRITNWVSFVNTWEGRRKRSIICKSPAALRLARSNAASNWRS